MYFFDLETGNRLRDRINVPNSYGGYDPLSNNFWFYKDNEYKPILKSFKVDGFKSREELTEITAKNLVELVKQRTQKTVEGQKGAHRIPPRSLESFLKKLGNKSNSDNVHANTHENDSVHPSLYLIMCTIGRGCEQVDTTMSEMDSLYPDLVQERLKCQSDLFRSQFAVTVSATFAEELVKALEAFNSFTDQPMSDENILEQYQFLWTVQLAHRFINTMDRLNIKLIEIVEDQTLRTRFTELLTQIVSKLAESGIEQERLQAVQNKDEVDSIWAECLKEARGIQNSLLSLASESSADLDAKINEAAKSLKDRDLTPSLIMFLKFLASSDSFQNILENKNLELIFEACCDIKANKLVNHINSIKLQNKYDSLEHDEIETVSHEFVYSYVKRSLLAVFVIQSKIAQALEKGQTKKVESLKTQAENNMKSFSTIYNKITACAQAIFRSTTEITKAITEENAKQVEAENANKDTPATNPNDKLSAFLDHILEVSYKHNFFLDFIHICVASLASERNHKMTKHLNNLCRKTIDLLQDMGKFEENLSQVGSSSNNDLMRFLIWSLSKIAHSFIKIKATEKKDDDHDTSQNLLKSKILSGGIENRFLATFSKETINTIENLATITGDNKLIKYLSGIELIDEDEAYLAIIHEGRDPAIDRLINLLQWNLLRRNPAAKVGGKEGMAVSRCAFAATLSLNQHEESCSYTNFIMMVDHLEISMDMVDEDANENQKNKQLMEELNSLDSIKPILDRWEIASKMRIWLQDKRKDISNTIKKKADAELRRREEEERLLQETKEKTAEDIEKDHKEENDEETIDTTSKKDGVSKIEAIPEEELLKRESEQVTLLVKKVSDKAELLVKLATPASWDQPDVSNNNLRAIDGYNADKEDKENKDENLTSKLQRIKKIQESKGTITSFENLSNKDVFNSCASSVLACLQCSVSAKSILKAVESKYINAMNRYCGLKIMGDLASCYMNDETKISCFNWFCSALRHNTNILAHYSDDLTGMGDYLLDKCRISFYEVYTGIVKQIKNTTDKKTLEFLLNCTKWRIGATDHQYILKSGIIQVLKDGNGLHDREKNPIKYSWGHNIDYKNYSGEETLSHMIIETLEFIMMACFSRILGEDEDKDLSMKKTGSAVQKIQQAYSVVNTNITEVLLASSFEIIFEQLSRYTNIINNFEPIDWKLFVEKRNELRINNQSLERDSNEPFEDEKTEEEKQKEAEEEKKQIEEEEKILSEQNAENRDRVREILNRRKEKEMKKLNKIYDEKVILKLLRLLEVFTAIALKNSKVHQFVIQVTRPAQILALVQLLLNCQSKHGMITLKVFNNLIRIGIDKQTLDDALGDLHTLPLAKELFALETKVRFEDCSFLQFCYNLLVSIRSSQWDKRKLQSYGAYNISCGVVRLFRTILRTQYQPLWRNAIEEALDDFIKNIDTYPIEEFDVLVSLFEGGEYNGMNIGAYGKTQDNDKFTTVGFVKQWYDLSTPDGQGANSNFEICDIQPEISSKDDYLLAIYYDEKHPERNDMFLAIPDEVTLVSNLFSTSSDYLLDKERLNNFLKAMEIDQMPDKNDSIALTKRCIGMKILVEHIEIYGEEIAKLFEESFRDKFINFLLNECSKVNEKGVDLKCEWYEQKLYAVRKLATESQTGLRSTSDPSIMFSGKMMSLTTTIGGTHEQYSKCLPLQGAMNFGCVAQKMPFKFIEASKVGETRFRNDNITVMKSSEIDTVEKLSEIFKHVNVVITSDLDLKTIHDQIKEAKNEEIAYFKKIINNGPKVKVVDTNNLSEHEVFCKELETFCGIERSKIDEIFKDKETEPLARKVQLLADFGKKDEKKDDKDDKKKEDDKLKDQGETFELIDRLENNSNLTGNLTTLTDFANNNYSSQEQAKKSKGDLYSKVYTISQNDIIGTYTNTLSALYKQLCRKTLSSFFDQLSLETLLGIILTSEENCENFVKYIQIRGNEAAKFKKSTNNQIQYEDFLNLMRRIIENCARNKEHSRLIDILLNKVILKGTAKILKLAANDKVKAINKLFDKEEIAIETLNTNLLPDTIKYLTIEVPEVINEPQTFKNLMTVLLMVPIVFREEQEFHKSIYMSVYKLLLPYVQEPQKYNNREVVDSILHHTFLKKIFEKLPQTIDPSNNNLTNEQKLLFEIYLLVRILEEITPEATSIFSYPDCVLDIEKCKQILKERKNFDLISYLVYLQKELTEEERGQKKVIETLHNRYKHKYTAKFQYSGFKKMEIKIDPESKLEKDAYVGFSNDSEGKIMIKKINQTNIDKNENVFNINSRGFYMHYPYNPPKIKCWGYGYNYKLGNNECYNTTTAPIIMPRIDVPIKKLQQRYNYVLAMTEDNKFWRCGYKSEWDRSIYYMEEFNGKLPEEKIIDFRCGYNNYAMLTEDHKIYIQGTDSEYHLDSGSTKKDLWHKERPNEEEEKVIAWDIGYDYHIYVTDNGKAYGAGNSFLKGMNLENNNKNYTQIPFDEGVIPLKPCCNNNYESSKSALMFVKTNDRVELWSTGYSSNGLLGQGDNKTTANKFTPLDYDKENITFKKAEIKYYFGMAVTENGELYGWGNNNYKQLGMQDTKIYYAPIKLPFFAEYYVHDFSCGQNHALVYASPRNEMENKKLFYTGDLRGIDTSGVVDGVLHLKDYDNVKIKWFEAGEEVCYVGFDGETKPTENVGVHTGYTCEVTQETPIVGTMHFWKGHGEWHFVSEAGFKKLKEEQRELPSIIYATKNHIKDIKDKEWPELNESELLRDEVDANYQVLYTAHNSNDGTKIFPNPKSNEDDIFKAESHDVNPLIFYRLARPLKEKAVLPTLALETYFEKTDLHGVKIEVTPDYSFEKNKDIIKIKKEKYNKTVDSIKNFEDKFDNELLEALESYISKNNIDFFNNSNTEINATDLEFSSKELKAKPAKEIQPRINAYISFNENFKKVIPFVLLDEALIKEVTEGKAEVKADTLSVLFMVSKSLAFRSTKNSYIKKIADSLPTNYEEPEVHFNRRLILHKKDRGKVDHKGEWTTFGTCMKKLKETNYNSLKKSSSSTKAWRAQFMGEGSIDAGGPYRESLTNITDELYSPCLPLLIPTQNNKNDHGLGRDLWTINPSSTSPSHLEMYKFLGALMGLAFRAGHVMDLKFPSIFWKKFIGEPIVLDDLHYYDAYAVQALKDVEKVKSQATREMFEEATDITFTTQLSNGETVSICEGGESRKVTFDDVEEYVNLVVKIRSEEGKKQMQAMREGFELIFPMSILSILNWRDVEERIRGPSEISVATLKSITEYSNCSAENEYVKRFWRVFEEFTNEEKSMFLKFVWGRARLPPADRIREQMFKLLLFDDYRFSNHDIQFPQAHTCWFQLDLPRYTNDEACKSKILYAIQACGEIDTDGSSYSFTDASAGWDDSD